VEASRDHVSPAIDLCGLEGALAVSLSEIYPDSGGVCANFTLPTIRAATQNLSKTNWLVAPCFGAPRGQINTYNSAFLRIPYWLGSKAVQCLIRIAHTVLRPHGKLWIAGERRRGSEAYRRFAELYFEKVDLCLAKRHIRVFRASKGSNESLSVSEKYGSAQFYIAGQTVIVAQGATVFSSGRIDPGTKLLAESIPAVKGCVLDFGCGSGILSVIASRCTPTPSVTAIDSNIEAIEVARQTFKLNDIQGVNIRASYFGQDLRDSSFDAIVCYPPFHVGPVISHDVGRRMLIEAARLLKPTGQCFIVLSRAQGYEGLLRTVFRRVYQIADTPRHCVVVGELPC
jgi:16S rRNA (guanine1207-N2)-methyltransferase